MRHIFKLMLFIFVYNKLVIVIAGFSFLLRNAFVTKLRSKGVKMCIFIPVSDHPFITFRVFTSYKGLNEKRVAPQELTAR